MKRILIVLLFAVLFLFAFGATCRAQQWEVGGGAGAAVYKNATASKGGVKADAGFKTGPVFSFFGIQNLRRRLSGEVRYALAFTDMKVSGNGAETTFSAETHAIHYNLLLYASDRESAIRPYASVGGGMKIFRGTGTESAIAPPLANLALLTKTQEVKGMLVFGGGVHLRAGKRTFVRLEALDYFTPTPKKVIAPAPGATISDWLHSFTPMVSVSFGF